MNPQSSRLTLEQRELFARRLAEEGLGSAAPRAIARRAGPGPAPLSYEQQQLWFLEQLHGSTSRYHIPSCLRLRGTLDREAFARAINDIVRRHDVLRTAIGTVDGQPVQVVAAALTVSVRCVDVQDDAEARALAAASYRQSFDLRTAPLFRVELFRLRPDEHVLLVVMHHIICDGSSMSVFYRELGALYNAHADETPSLPLPELSVQYADFAQWQRERLDGAALDEHLAYWREHLAGAPERLELPADGSRPETQTFRGGVVSRRLDAPLYEAVQELGRQQDATLFMTTLAVFAMLLHRQSGQEDLVVGSAIAGREHAELEPMIGSFAGVLPLRVQFAEGVTFRALLARVRDTVLDAFAHQQAPFEKIVEAVPSRRRLGASPIFQVLFNVIRFDDEIRLGGLEIGEVGITELDSKFDLTLYVFHTTNGLRLELIYNRDLFSRARMDEMLAQFERLLPQICARPDLPVEAFTLTGECPTLPNPRAVLERRPPFEAVSDRFTTHASGPGAARPAIEDAFGAWSYGEVAIRSHRVASWLSSHGVGRGDIVAIWGDRRAALMPCILGVWRAGAGFLVLDPAYPARRLSEYLDAIPPKAWIAVDGAPAVPADLAARVAALPQVPLAGWDRAPRDGEDRLEVAATEARDTAYIVCTSGTTGAPNAIESPHDALSHFLAWHCATFALTAHDRFSLLSGLSHDPLLRDIATPLWLGATLCVPEPEALRSPGQLRAWLNAERVTVLHATPALLELLTAGATDDDTLPALRYVFSGGDLLTQVMVDRIAARAPGATVVNFYGASETPQAMAWHVATAAGADDALRAPVIPIGHGIDGVQLLVVNRAGQLAGVGELGEIHVRTPYLSKGYAGDEARTRRAFITNSCTGDDADRLYRTGDLGRYLPDGGVAYHGRADAQLKVRGFRVEAGEIERLLCEHPPVQQAVVCLKDDASGHPLLVAFLTGVPVADRTRVLAEIRGRLAARVPAYMVPALFVTQDALPLTPNHKIDIRRLTLPAADLEQPLMAGGTMDEGERRVSALWRALLPGAEIGPQDNFFDVGGNSLLLLRLHQNLRDTFATDVTLIELFRYPTISAMARRIVHHDAGGAGVSEPARRRDMASADEKPATARPAASGSGKSGDIAIVGMAGRFPGAANVDEFWRNVRDGVESIAFYSPAELAARGVAAATLADPAYVPAGAPLAGLDLFDAAFFGFTPREAEVTDPQHRLFLECAWEALERAGYQPRDPSRRVGVFAGASANTYLLGQVLRNVKRLNDGGGFNASVLHGNEKDYLPARVAYKLGLRGPAMAIQTACSTSLVAVSHACQSLRSGECDMALAGGVAANVWQEVGYVYERDGIMSPDGRCRAFDARAQGTVFGSGVGVVVLKRLEEALADGDEVVAVIKGFALNNDGAERVGFTAPGIDGQTAVVRAAHADAGVDPETVTYVEAHGTGTSLGDPIEVEALTRAYRASTAKVQYCAIGSVKTNVGHLNAAAGVAGLIKAALAVRDGLLPPSLHYEQPNPRIDFAASPFYVNTRLQPWVSDGPRRAGVSSFGIGGTNAHVVIEQAPPRASGGPSRRPQILSLSARTPAALRAAALQLADHLAAQPDTAVADLVDPPRLADTAYTLAVGRKGFAQRIAVVCADSAEAIAALRDPDAPPSVATRGVWTGAPRGVAVLIAGQGSQYVGMGRELYRQEAVFREEIDRAAAFLQPILGLDLRVVMHTDPDALLRQTWVTQPALYVLACALLKQWAHWGVEPVALLGHSLGELVAATAAGVWDEEAGLRLVAARGRLMWATEPGAMVSALVDEQTAARYAGAGVSIAAVNGRQQIVFSGGAAAMTALRARFETDGVPVRALAVERAFHSPTMDAIGEAFLEEVRGLTLRPPTRRFLSNVTGTWAGDEVCEPEYWWRQARQPVRFASGLRELARAHDGPWLEIGPGDVLGRLARAELREPARAPIVVASLGAAPGGDQRHMAQALATLWVEGAPIDWPAYYRDEHRHRVALPTYPFERQRYWIDAEPGEEADSARTAGRTPDLADWFYVPSWRRSSSLTAHRARTAATRLASPLVLLDALGAGAALVEQLEREGRQPIVVRAGATFERVSDRHYQIDPGQAEHYTRLIGGLRRDSRMTDAIFHLWLLTPPAGDYLDPDRAERTQATGFYSLLFLAQAMRGHAASLLVVASGLHEVCAGDVVEPDKATAIGACRVIPQEYDELSVRCVDIASSDVARGEWSAFANAFIADLAGIAEDAKNAKNAASAERSGGREPRDSAGRGAAAIVAYRNGYRWNQIFEPARLPAASTPVVRAGGVYLLTGGLGGIALALARRFASLAPVKLALVSRAALPARADWIDWNATHAADETTARRIAAIRALEAQGAEVLVLQADVTDRSSMAEAIARVRETFGPITGAIHAAGLSGGGVVELKTAAMARRVIAPKLTGMLVLADLLAGEPLDFLAACSSRAAVLGGVGQVDYCAANNFLDAFVLRHARSAGVPAVAIGWAAWRDVGMAADAAGPDGGVDPALGLLPGEGVETFERILAAGLTQVVVSPQPLAEVVARRRDTRAPSPVADAGPARRESDIPYRAPGNPLESAIAAIWERLLGVRPVGTTDDFLQLGGHSLLGTQVLSQIRATLQADISLRDLFERPTVAGLAALVAERRGVEQVELLGPSHAMEARRPPIGDLPLSWTQQRLWLLDQVQAGSSAYNISSAIQLSGPLRRDALDRALVEIVRRHESLRTTFHERDGAPLQRIAEARTGLLTTIDLTALTDDAREIGVGDAIDREAGCAFDLSSGPLFRACLLRLGAERHVLQLTMHHIVSDGWSVGLLRHELAACYNAFAAGRRHDLGDLPVQYRDYTAWLREDRSEARFASQLTYWRTQLAQAPVLLDLPADRPRPRIRGEGGSTESALFPPHLLDSLHALGRETGATLFMVLLAAFNTILNRYSGQHDILVGSPIAGRTRAELEALIGCFVNMLVLRTDLGGDPSFRTLVGRVRDVCLTAYANQDLPFERLLDELAIARSLRHTPLVQVVFVLQNAPREALALDGLRAEPMPIRGVTAKFDLTLTMQESAEGLRAWIEYSTDLFDRDTIRRMLGHLETLLASAVADPARPVSRLAILTESERRERVASDADAFVCVTPPSIVRWFEDQAARSPDAIAVTADDQRLSYRDLNAGANRLAHHLVALGVRGGDFVGICLDRSAAMIVSIVAVLKTGAAYVPMDPAYPAERLQFIVRDARVAVTITESRFAAARAAAGHPSSPSAVVALDVDADRIAACSDRNLDEMIPADAAAYVIYTSGSTGGPKGVPVTHHNVMRLLRATEPSFAFDARDVWTLFHSFGFDFSVWEMWGALLYGGRLVIVPYWVSRTPEAFRELLARERVTVLNQTPSAFRQLDAADAAADAGAPLHLRYVIFGGEALDLHALRPWIDRHGDDAPRLVNMYGITETTVHVTCRRIQTADVRTGARSLIGAPIPDLQIHILDAHMEPAAVGCSAEIYVGGAGVARGYLHRPELTAERFVPDPFGQVPGARLYRSGDLGRRVIGPDGSGDIEYVGRADQQVKIRGFRIELGEIEAALTQHPALREARVVVQSDRTGEKQLMAYLVARDAAAEAIDPAAMRAFLGERLPDYMMPSAFVVLDRIPLTAHGKIDAAALPEASRATAGARGDGEQPRTDAERTLAEIWSGVLDLDRPDIDTSFFALGGDSIRSIRVRSMASARGLPFTLQQLFQHQTIRALAAGIAGGAPSAPAPDARRDLLSVADRAALPARIEDAYPLTMLQAGMVFHSELNQASAVYHDVFSYQIHATVDETCMREAVSLLLGRHALLRTSFDLKTYSVPLQLVHRDVQPPIEWEDGSALLDGEQDEAIARWLLAERARPFEWGRAPLLRMLVYRRAAARFQFALSFHHAILDGWSVASLMTELLQIYAGRLAGEAFDAPSLASSFRDFVALELETLAAPDTQAYWRDKLAGAPVTLMSRDTAAVANDLPRRVQSHRVTLPASLSAELHGLARRLGVPVKSALLAAHLRVLGRATAAADIVCGLVTNGRPEEADGERVLGLFLNTVPLRMTLRGGAWQDLVRAAFVAETELLPHRRFPLAAMRRAGDEGGPLFDTVFNFIHFHVYEGLDRLQGLTVSDAQAFEETNFSLVANFSLAGDPASLHLTLIHDPVVVSPQRVAEIAGCYVRALEAMTARPEARYDRDDLLSDDERTRVLVTWNETARPRPANQTVHGLFTQQAAARPDAVAVTTPDMSLTYRQLDRASNRLAHDLRGRGVTAETHVGVCVHDGARMALAALGIMKSGGAYVPIEPAHPPERRAMMLASARAPFVLTDDLLATILDASPDTWSDTPPDCAVASGQVAYTIYTSGSTGVPKGVAITHASLLNLVAWHQRAYDVTPADRASQIASLGFDASVWEIWPYLTAGASVHIPDADARNSPRRLVQWLERQRITLCFLPTPLAEAALDESSMSGLHTLRALLTGGDRLRRGPRAALPFRLVNHYGPTENTVVATWTDVAAETANPPIGRPLDNVRTYVVDDAMLPVGTGNAGELYLGGDGLARGYVGDPAQTAERFVPDALSGGSGLRLYRTGDVVRWQADGRLDFLGRKDEQVKLRGHRIEPGEIETAIKESGGVHDVAVLLRSDEAGGPLLVAYVVMTGPVEELAEQELRARLAEKLPPYMMPGVFIFLPDMPLTVSGKIDRRRLPAPDARHGAADREHRAPRTDLQRQVAEIWSEVLGGAIVGLSDNFFALGGDSLKAMRCIARLGDAMPPDLPLRLLFDAPELEAFVLAMVDAQTQGASAAEIEALLAGMDGLSDEDASARLANRAGEAANV